MGGGPADWAGMTAQAGADEIDRMVAELLDTHPRAAVAAIRLDALLAPVPASVEIGDHPVLRTRACIDLFATEDRPDMLRAWQEALATGVGRTTGLLANGTEGTFHFLDTRPRHGVLLGILLTDGDLESLYQSESFLAVRPRVCVLRMDAAGAIVRFDAATLTMLGHEPDGLVGRYATEFVHLDDQPRGIDHWLAALSSPERPHRVRLRWARGDGTWLWVEGTFVSHVEDDRIEVEVGLVDISEEMAATEALHKREHLLRRLTEAMPSGVVQIDAAGHIVHKNERTDQLVGHPEATTLEEQLASAQPADLEELRGAIGRVLNDGADRDLEVRLTPSGQRAARVCHVALRALTEEDGQVDGAIVSISDVTDSTVLREELEVRATFDALTGCHNRASIMALLEATLARRRPGTGVAVIFIDLDRFKPVNDRFGHATGDRLLSAVADRLKATTRTDDTVGRVGGDEFLVVCPAIAEPHIALEVARRAVGRLRGAVHLGDVRVEVVASVGVAWSCDDDIAADALVAMADAAMYDSKRQGGGRPVLRTELASGRPSPVSSRGRE
jgi:diguanylate cyclase (GGDEF)-like protein/PAS domain S-box-containing protein